MLSMLRNMKLSRKFAVAFGSVSLLTAILGIASLIGFMRTNTSIDDLVKDAMPSIKSLGEIRYAMSTIRRSETNQLLCTTSECAEYYGNKRQKAIETYNNSIEAYSDLVSSPAERELFGTFRQDMTAYLSASNRMMELYRLGKRMRLCKCSMAQNCGRPIIPRSKPSMRQRN